MARKRKTTLARQAEIVDAARKLIIKYGSEHLTVRRIAKEIGVSEGALYRHFKSKRDILFLLVEHIEQNLLGDIGLDREKDSSPLLALDGLLRDQISSIEQRRGVSFQIIAEIISLGDRKLNAKVTGAIDRYVQRIEEMLHRGVEAGEIREEIDLVAAASLLFGLVQGLVNMWALSDYGFNLEQKFASAWGVFREAVIPRRTDTV
ncbi:MAG: TetR/AcrR family transcriptional regulator [Chloroflexi bacterium]|nr:TetR/AcrR family transcriptional regulator [Chloroflexota bacterium]